MLIKIIWLRLSDNTKIDSKFKKIISNFIMNIIKRKPKVLTKNKPKEISLCNVIHYKIFAHTRLGKFSIFEHCTCSRGFNRFKGGPGCIKTVSIRNIERFSSNTRSHKNLFVG